MLHATDIGRSCHLHQVNCVDMEKCYMLRQVVTWKKYFLRQVSCVDMERCYMLC